MKHAIYLLLLLPGLLFTRCELINPEEEIPAYLHIDTFLLQTDYTKEGTASHSITDVWVLTGGEIIGAFELPATIPVLRQGTHEVFINAGIKVNGIANTRGVYPFYTIHAIAHDFKPGQVDTIKPVVEYLDTAVFPLMDDFETNISRFDTSSLSKTGYELTTDPAEVFEGSKSLKITLTDAADAFELVSRNPYKLPRLTDVYAELNYKTENVFYIGLIATGPNTYYKSTVIGINPSSEWKKIYVNLSNLVTNLQPNLDFRVYISGELDAGRNNSVILLDNFKLVHKP